MFFLIKTPFTFFTLFIKCIFLTNEIKKIIDEKFNKLHNQNKMK